MSQVAAEQGLADALGNVAWQPLAALSPTLFHLRHRLEGLRLDTGADDLASLADQQLASVAGQLISLRGSGPDGDIAESALRRLFTFARQAERAGR